jgi:hypothetical protein
VKNRLRKMAQITVFLGNKGRNFGSFIPRPKIIRLLFLFPPNALTHRPQMRIDQSGPEHLQLQLIVGKL